MKTRSPISTISYNTPAFLQLKLEELRKAKIISLWFFVQHKKEEDEKKDHIHLWILPSRQIQTDDLVEQLIEPVPGHDKPLKSLHFLSSKFEDWYLYVIHDVGYLARKGQVRKFHYSIDDFVVCDRDELDEMVHQIDMTKNTSFEVMVNAVKQGLTFREFVQRGSVPLQQFSQWQAAWNFLSSAGSLYRGSRSTHSPDPDTEPVTDPETGEVLDDEQKV